MRRKKDGISINHPAKASSARPRRAKLLTSRNVSAFVSRLPELRFPSLFGFLGLDSLFPGCLDLDSLFLNCLSRDFLSLGSLSSSSLSSSALCLGILFLGSLHIAHAQHAYFLLEYISSTIFQLIHTHLPGSFNRLVNFTNLKLSDMVYSGESKKKLEKISRENVTTDNTIPEKGNTFVFTNLHGISADLGHWFEACWMSDRSADFAPAWWIMTFAKSSWRLTRRIAKHSNTKT